MEGGEAGNESECRLLACGSMSIIVLGNGSLQAFPSFILIVSFLSHPGENLTLPKGET